jgi:hypothetical protein
LHESGLQQPRGVRGIETHEEATVATVHVHARQVQDRPFHEDAHRLAGSERARPANQVAAVLRRDLRLRDLDALRADLPCERPGAHLEVAVHQHDQRRAGLVLHDERLDHRVFVHAELPRRHAGAAVFLVPVEVLGVGDAVRLEEPDRGRDRGPGHSDIIAARDSRSL